MAASGWQGMIENVAAKGLLAKRMYVVFTSPTGGMEAVMANLEAHLAYQIDLEARGIMFGAGPFADDTETDWHGEGMSSCAPPRWPRPAPSPRPIRCTAPARASFVCAPGF